MCKLTTLLQQNNQLSIQCLYFGTSQMMIRLYHVPKFEIILIFSHECLIRNSRKGMPKWIGNSKKMQEKYKINFGRFLFYFYFKEKNAHFQPANKKMPLTRPFTCFAFLNYNSIISLVFVAYKHFSFFAHFLH